MQTNLRSSKHPPCSSMRLIALIFSGVFAVNLSVAAQEAPPRVVIRDVTLIDGTGSDPQGAVDILTEGRKIQRIGADLNVPPDAEVITGDGKFVVPGLIDAHVHLNFPIVFQISPEERQSIVEHTPKAFLYNGVTTVLNVSSDADWIWDKRREQRAGHLVSPRIYATGHSFAPEDGWGSRHGGALPTAAAARQRALEYVAADTDGFKIVIEDGLGGSGTYREMPDDMLAAIVGIAREHMIPMYVHAINLSEYRRAVTIRPRAIIHGLEDPIDADSPLLDEMREHSVAVVPTLSLFNSFLYPDPRAGEDLDDPVLEGTVPGFLLERMRDPAYMEEERRLFITESARMDAYGWAESRVPVFCENVRKMHQSGVSIAAGTDGGGTVGFNFQGYNTPWEVKLFVQCGLTPMEAIVAATRNGAEVIGILDELGTIEEGKLADMLILTADPLDDIENLRKIESIVQDGQVYERGAFAYEN